MTTATRGSIRLDLQSGQRTTRIRQCATSSYELVVPSGNLINDRFGFSVAVDEGRILVGAPTGVDQLPATFATLYGTAHLFEQEGSVGVETASMLSAERRVEEHFGTSVAIDGDTIMVGVEAGFVNDVRVGRVEVFRLPFGETICAPVLNSTGAGALQELSGERRIEFGNLRTKVMGLPANSYGFVIASLTTQMVQNPGGSQGTLCLGGAVSRLLSTAGRSDAAGVFEAQLDPAAMPTPQSGPVSIVPGDQWAFQLWYRDANPVPTSNFSSAVRATFR